MTDFLPSFVWLGVSLIIVGAALVLVPLLVRQGVSWEALQHVHPFLLYVYRSDGFTFATSPALIVAGLAVFFWRYFTG